MGVFLQNLDLLKRHHGTSIIVLILCERGIVVDLSIYIIARVQVELVLKNRWLIRTSHTNGL